jgi:hypothetical protein
LIPGSDAEVPAFTEALGLPGLTDLHLHFLPEPVQRKVWAYFDEASENYGTPWPVHYRLPVDERLKVLRDLGVRNFAPLAYPHKPGMAAWLNEWLLDFVADVPEAVPTATFFPEPGVGEYLKQALDQGVRCVKSHVQIGGYDPRDPLLDDVWGMLAEAAVPVVVHCGNGPIPGKHTGLDIFEDVLRQHPRLVAVLAHAGLPEHSAAVDLAERYAGVHLDTTMVGVPFNGADELLPPDWAARLVAIADKVALGTDFPSIPYDYATQLRAIATWANADDRLGDDFLRAVLWGTPRRLLAVGEQHWETS